MSSVFLSTLVCILEKNTYSYHIILRKSLIQTMIWCALGTYNLTPFLPFQGQLLIFL